MTNHQIQLIGNTVFSLIVIYIIVRDIYMLAKRIPDPFFSRKGQIVSVVVVIILLAISILLSYF